MEEGLKSKLLANDEISLEMEGVEEAEDLLSTATQLTPMELSWHDIIVAPAEDENRGCCSSMCSCCCSKKDDEQKRFKRRLILNRTYGIAKAGEVLAIMGSSGAGKSTLLNVLTQRNLGGVEVEGHHPRERRPDEQQGDPPDDRLRNHSKQERNRRVRMVMAELGLTHVAKTRIGSQRLKGISGGEKKRLAFGSEILTSPQILICDEPTSGLDAYLGLGKWSAVLRNIAEKKGMTVILTIHQPSSQVFELFDKILLLAEGRTAFWGTTEQAMEQWKRLGDPLPEQFNPGDHFISSLDSGDLSERKATEKINAKNLQCVRRERVRAGAPSGESNRRTLRHSSSSSCASEAINSSIRKRKTYQASWCQQFGVLTKRASQLCCSELYYLNTEIKQTTVMNVNGLLFQATSAMNFMFQFASVGLVHGRVPRLHARRSRATRTEWSSTFSRRTLPTASNISSIPIVFSSILYWMTGLYRSVVPFLWFTLQEILMVFVGISIAYAAACVFARVDVAIAVLPIYVIPLLAFGGFFINVSTLPWFFIPFQKLSYFGYAFENTAIVEWSNAARPPPRTRRVSPNGPAVLRSLSFSPSNFFWNIGWMLAMIVGFRLIALVALLIRANKRK
ncbi:ATP-binding cassette sub-family G member 2 [Aphelenchoides fujianensis]|nr:ATP-binding cassette sub-family G member 2 [Aphelenchoides fujianensis]